jgi:hypothetical protein
MRGKDLLVEDRFSAEALALRAHFDERLADPRQARADRFVWDYWHVPGQYTQLRTPAYHFFPRRSTSAFIAASSPSAGASSAATTSRRPGCRATSTAASRSCTATCLMGPSPSSSR